MRVTGPEGAAVIARRGIGAAFLVLCAAASTSPIHSFDLFWYLRAAEEIVRQGGLPPVDTLSYTAAGLPWLNHEWLTELLFLGIQKLGDFVALSLVPGLGVAAVVALVARGATAASGSASTPRTVTATAASIGALGAMTAVLREGAEPRAQLLSNVLFAATLAICARDARAPSPRILWVLLLGVLWTNLHGGNPTGAILCGILFVSRPSRLRAAAAGGAVLATICGPYGPAVHGHFLGSQAALPLVREWMPIWQPLSAGAPAQWIFIVLLGAAIVVVVVRVRRGDGVRFQALALLVFGALAVRWVRFTLEASMVAALCLAPELVRVAAASKRAAMIAASSAVLGFAMVAVAVAASPNRPGVGLDERRLPAAAVGFLKARRPPGPMFNGYNYGSYLLWAYPEEKVFVDGRAFTLYPNEHIAALVDVYDRPDRFADLEARWNFRLAVLQRSGRGAALDRWLRARPGWQIAHEDPGTTVLTRRR